MGIPIVFMHVGDEDYVWYSSQQAKTSNPSSDVILLGNERNRMRATGSVRHEMMHHYMQGATEFASVYKHVSPNSYEYNLFCFQRWFILRDYMRRNQVDVVCYLDSDVMLYADISDPKYRHFSFEFTWTSIVGLPELEQFCAVTAEQFAYPHLFEQLNAYTVAQGQPAVSDMVLFSLYADRLPGYRRCHGLFQGEYFDGNINHVNFGFEATRDGSRKKVFRSEDGLYFREASTGKRVRVNSIHFQGPPCKPFMSHFIGPNMPTDRTRTHYFDYDVYRWIRE